MFNLTWKFLIGIIQQSGIYLAKHYDMYNMTEKQVPFLCSNYLTLQDQNPND